MIRRTRRSSPKASRSPSRMSMPMGAIAQRDERLEDLINRLKTERDHKPMGRANPKSKKSKATRKRSGLVDMSADSALNDVTDLVKLVRKAEATYKRTKSARAKKNLAKARKMLADFKKERQSELTTLDKLEKDLTMARANPRKRRRKSTRKTTARKASSTTRRRTATKKRRSTTKRRKTAGVSKRRANPVRRRRKSTKRRASTVSRKRRMSTTSRKRRASTISRKRRRSTTRRRRRNPISTLGNISTLGRMNHITPLGMRHLGMRHNPMSTGMKVAVGAGSFVASLAVTNAITGGLKRVMSVNAKAFAGNTKATVVELGGHVLSASLPAYYLYSQRNNVMRSERDEQHRVMAMGWLAGVVGTAVARNFVDLGKVPVIGGLMRMTNPNEKNDNLFAEPAKTVSGLSGRRKVFLNGLGATRRIPARRGRSVGTYFSDKGMGSYFSDKGMGRYVQSSEDNQLGRYVPSVGRYLQASEDNQLSGTRRVRRSVRGLSGAGINERNPLLHQPEVITGTARNFSPSKNNDMMKEIAGIDCLDSNELAMEGLDATALEGTYFCRALPDYARRIVQANLGLVVQNSKVMQGAMVLQLFVDPEQVVNRTQIGGQPDQGKGAHHMRNAGIFTGGIFNSVIPAVDNGYSWSDE